MIFCNKCNPNISQANLFQQFKSTFGSVVHIRVSDLGRFELDPDPTFDKKTLSVSDR